MMASIRSLAGLCAVMFAAAACVDGALPTSPVDRDQPDNGTPQGPNSFAAGDYRVDVNLITGEVVATPVHSEIGGNVAGRFYGSSNQVAFRFQQPPPPQITLPDGRKVFTLNVRMENLLPHRVGTTLMTGPVASPLGIQVYVSVRPFVTAGCQPMTAGCNGAVYNADGRAAFTEPNQDYWFFNQHLEANDGVASSGSDLSNLKQFQFVAGANVTNMTFGISVNAAWALPTETHVISWSSAFNPLTGTGGAQWTPLGTGTTTYRATGCSGGNSPCLELTSTGTNANKLYRSDPLLPSQSAFMEGTVMKVSLPNGNHPVGVLGFADGDRFIQVGMSGNQVGFTNVGSTSLFQSQQYHLPDGPITVRVVKDQPAGQVRLFLDGALVMTVPYTSFPPTPYTGPGTHPTFWFGNHGHGITQWLNVSYGIGTTAP